MKTQSISLAEGFALLKDGDRVVTAMAAAEPQLFFSNAHLFLQGKKDVKIFCANPNENYACFTDPELDPSLKIIPMFLTKKIRPLQGRNRVHYIPQHLSQWAHNLTQSQRVNIFWGSCTPPDARGFVSLGPSCCYESELVRKADLVILECNPGLPVTYGSTHIPLREVDYLIESTCPVPELRELPEESPIHQALASHIANLIEDGSTLQIGIGSIPNSVCKQLKKKSDLGIHTEMIHNGMLDLYRNGNITGHHKSFFPGKIVGSFALGDHDLYQFIHLNPGVELHPASFVNKLKILTKNTKMISINTAVEVDITGQVCSESIGHMELSGVGGAWETHVGAQMSPGGRGILALTSTTKDEKTSKISFELKPGAKVSISRNDVDTIVTEYGVARLRGRSVAERADDLISIAHPKFREELRLLAKKVGYI